MSSKTDVAAIILAGGRGSRLGRDKASELLLGVPLLQRVIDRLAGVVDEYVIVRRDAAQVLPPVSATAPLRVIEDAHPDAGPLGGLHTGLQAIAAPLAVAVACDMPLLQPALLAEMVRRAPGHDAVVPLSDGLPQPLCAVYSRDCVDAMRRHLERGQLRLTGFLEAINVLYFAPQDWRPFDPDGLSFQNVNREQDLQRAAAILSNQFQRL